MQSRPAPDLMVSRHIKQTIKRNQFGEWVVRTWINGKRDPECDYFTPDKADAHANAEREAARIANQSR